MQIRWTSKALSDLVRLHEFLAAIDQQAAARVVQALTQAPNLLKDNPRLGEQLFQFAPREVRRLQVQRYELRYEVARDDIYILRLWHNREDR